MEKTVRSSFQYLSISYECALAIGNSLDLSEMLQEVIHIMVHKTNGHRGIIWVSNEEGKLQPVASAGINIDDMLAQSEIMNLRDVFSQIQKKQQFILKYKDDKDFLRYCPVLTGKEESVLIVPITNVALIHLIYANREIADEPLANLLISLSKKLRVAIEACRAHENVINEIRVREEVEKELTKKTEQLISNQKELQGLYGESEQARKLLMSTLEEVTQKEKALKESESKLNSILSSINDLVFVLDQEERFILIQNPKSEQLYTAADECIGKKTTEVLPPHLNTILLDAFDKIRKGQVAEYDYWLTIDGKIRWFSAKHSPRLIDGELIGSVSLVRDITERKLAEEALRDSESKFKRLHFMLRLMCDNLPELIWTKDLDCKFMFANKACCDDLLNARDTDEPVGKTDIYFADREKQSHPENPNYHTFGETCISSDKVVLEFRKAIRTEQLGNVRGKSVIFDVLKAPFWDEEGKLIGTVGCAKDITERKQAEEEREKLRGQLAHAQKMESIGRLAGGVAHDFNNMLGVILGNAEMAMEEVDPAQQFFENLQEIRMAALHSADLTRQLLAFARKQTVAPRVLDINETVEGMLKMLRRLIGEDTDLTWLPGLGMWPVNVDPSQIDQILANLCINARDAIEDVGNLIIETRNVTFDEAYCASHLGFVSGEYVLLTVSDNGCGMDKETLDRLFEPFFTTKEMGKGTGLGLATVYGIVKQNNGFINVYSELEQGTAFQIYLPRHAAETTQIEKESQAEPAKRGCETILLVEDEQAILKLTTMMLERQGYTVLAASTPSEAIRLTEAHSGEIHLLLTDVVMPEMNGRDMVKNFLPLFPNLKCLFMSGYTANVIAHHGVLDEGVQFIQKPFSKQGLVDKVREALDSK